MVPGELKNCDPKVVGMTFCADVFSNTLDVDAVDKNIAYEIFLG